MSGYTDPYRYPPLEDTKKLKEAIEQDAKFKKDKATIAFQRKIFSYVIAISVIFGIAITLIMKYFK